MKTISASVVLVGGSKVARWTCSCSAVNHTKSVSGPATCVGCGTAVSVVLVPEAVPGYDKRKRPRPSW